jgi:hypothetical protein
MAKRALTQETYDRLLAGYRETPGNASQAARKAGVDRRTAARVWEKGWPQYDWALPIRNVLMQERENARLDRVRLQDQERAKANSDRERARADAIRANNEEAQAVSVARQNAIGVSALLQSVVRAMIPLAKTIEQDLQQAKLSVHEKVNLLGKTTGFIRHANESIRISLEVERIRLGQPTHVFNAQSHLDDVTTEEAVQEILGVQKSLHRALAAQNYDDGSVTIDIPVNAYVEDE